MPGKSFDNLAKSYQWIEALTFGGFLQKCRIALLPKLLDARRALVLGEGDGRFLAEFCQANTHATIDCLDKSPSMVRIAKKRIQRIPGVTGRIHFHLGDAITQSLLPGQYDLVVCNFFLDCFTPGEILTILLKIKRTLSPGGRILIGDFQQPAGVLLSILTRLPLAIMHTFFRTTAGISAKALVDTTPLLHGNGFLPLDKKELLFGFLHSSLWESPT